MGCIRSGVIGVETFSSRASDELASQKVISIIVGQALQVIDTAAGTIRVTISLSITSRGGRLIGDQRITSESKRDRVVEGASIREWSERRRFRRRPDCEKPVNVEASDMPKSFNPGHWRGQRRNRVEANAGH
jgi:hypothetical protein